MAIGWGLYVNNINDLCIFQDSICSSSPPELPLKLTAFISRNLFAANRNHSSAQRKNVARNSRSYHGKRDKLNSWFSLNIL